MKKQTLLKKIEELNEEISSVRDQRSSLRTKALYRSDDHSISKRELKRREKGRLVEHLSLHQSQLSQMNHLRKEVVCSPSLEWNV